MYKNLLWRVFLLELVFLAQALCFQALLPEMAQRYHYGAYLKFIVLFCLGFGLAAAWFWAWFWRGEGLQRNPWLARLSWVIFGSNLVFGLAMLNLVPDVFYYLLPITLAVWLGALSGFQIQLLGILPTLQPRHQFVFVQALFMGLGVSVLWSRHYLAWYLGTYDESVVWTVLGLVTVMARNFWSAGVLPERYLEDPSLEREPQESPNTPSLLSVLAWGMLASWLLLLPFSGLFEPNPWSFAQGQRLWLFLGYWLLVLPLTFFGNQFKRPAFALGLFCYALASLGGGLGFFMPLTALSLLIVAYGCTLPYPWVLALAYRKTEAHLNAAAWHWAGWLLGATSLLGLYYLSQTSF